MDPIYIIAGLVALAFVLALAGRSGGKGAEGERRVARKLHQALDASQYRILNDVTLPARDGTTQIDHVVLSRFGVFVIETKNMSGWIFGAEDQALWTQAVYRKKSRFQNPLRQNYGHVRTLQDLLDLDPNQAHNIVAFVGTATPKTHMPPNVVWSTYALTAFLASHQTQVIDPGALDGLAARILAVRLEPGRKTSKAHVDSVKARMASRGPDGTGCPRCGGDMVARTTKKSGRHFLGCVRYPACKGMRESGSPKVLAFDLRAK